MKLISLMVLSFVTTSMALPQFNQALSNQQQQGFPNTNGNQNPFLPENQRGQQPIFGNQQLFGSQQKQRPGFGGFGGGEQQQQQQQTGFGGQQEWNNSNQQQTTTAAPGSSSSIVETRQFVLCNQNCPSVNQYNPICGSDQVTYNNQYRLDCANDCGRQLDPNWQEITIFSRRNCVSGSRVA